MSNISFCDNTNCRFNNYKVKNGINSLIIEDVIKNLQDFNFGGKREVVRFQYNGGDKKFFYLCSDCHEAFQFVVSKNRG